MNPTLLHLTTDWAAADKPPGLLCHPTKPGGPPTLRDWFHAHDPGSLAACVNRLDRETSGIVLIARTRSGASSLGRLMMRHGFRKTYLALVHGHPPEQAVIDAPLARLGDHGPSAIYLKQGVIPTGAPALTRIRRIETRLHPTAGPLSLIECSPQTGRLHQIRVHLAHIGHPVVGDKLYGTDPTAYLEFIRTGWTDSLAARLLHPRHALHASALTFSWENQDITLTSPLPPDLTALWNSCTPTNP
jgi:23S rRNA pseudouridine1911/1915/1917 synthase